MASPDRAARNWRPSLEPSLLPTPYASYSVHLRKAWVRYDEIVASFSSVRRVITRASLVTLWWLGLDVGDLAERI